MKRSKPWLMSILIASVLLLSGGKNGAQQKPESAQPRNSLPTNSVSAATQTQKRNLDQEQRASEADAGKNPSSSEHLVGANTGKGKAEDQRNQHETKRAPETAPLSGFWTRISGWNWVVIFTGVLTLVTAIQARLLYEQTTSDRPFLVPESFEIENFAPGSAHKPLKATMQFRNYGKGPAFIASCQMALAIVDRFPFWRRYGLCEMKEIQKTVLGTDESTEKILAYLVRPDGVPPKQQRPVFTESEHADIVGGRLCLVFYGRLKYRDSFKRRHRTGFFWVCEPPNPYPPVFRTAARFIPGPPTRNYYR